MGSVGPVRASPIASDGVMYRFLLRPKWIAFHLLVVVAIVAMVNFGFWQLRRLDQRRDFNATIEERYDEPPVPLDELLTPSSDPDDVEWRPVTAEGTYLTDGQFVVVNRSQNGRAGRNVVVPLQLDDGRILLVNRGFVPYLVEDVPEVAASDVEIVGRLRASQTRSLGQLSDPADGTLREAQRVDIPRLAEQLPGEVVPMYVDLVSSTPAEATDLPEPVATPDLSEGNHLSYAVQWFIFSIAVAVGWVLAVRRSIATRRREKADTAGSPADREPITAD
jgi:cytochrome oxidase assembly protein ShyY1